MEAPLCNRFDLCLSDGTDVSETQADVWGCRALSEEGDEEKAKWAWGRTRRATMLARVDGETG